MNSSRLDPKKFHNTFTDIAKRNDDVLSYYVNRADDSGHDSVEVMSQAVEWEEEGENGCYLFSGLRGSGKTTELKRLMKVLDSKNIPTLYCSADEFLDLNDPTITQAELIFTAIAGLCDSIKKEYGRDFLQETIWDRTKNIMNSDVDLKAKVGTSDAGIEFTLKENTTFKKELVEFSKSSDRFFEEARVFIFDLVEKIRNKTGENKIVLIVDSLERLSAPPGQEQELFNSLETLFFNHSERIFLPGITVIYTVPPYLHAVLPSVDQFYSGAFSLPNFKVMKKPDSGAEPLENQSGLDQMIQLIEKRDSDWEHYFSRAVMEHFAWLSGGNVRRMFSLVRHATRKAALIDAEFPVSDIGDKAVEQAIQEETKNLHWLNAKDRLWLKHCREDGADLAQHIQELKDDLPPVIRLFDHSLVLNYQNGSIWYQVPPIVNGYV
ncbi:MAG: ATP-binding protein [Oceanobacter sp.]